MASPCRVEEWFQLVPQLICEEGWDVLIDGAKSCLLHCDCPWGGELLKIRVDAHVENVPENPSHLLVRPEVRALYGNGSVSKFEDLQMLIHQAPGEAFIEQLHSWGLGSFCSSFLEASDETCSEEFSTRKSSWQRLSRDFPGEGDSSLCVQGDSLGLLLCRPKGGSRYEINGIFHVTEEQFKQWNSIYLRLLFESASRTARWFVNRPGISDLRSIDRSFYTTLTVQSCRRGLPLLPCPPGDVEDEVVTIADGEALGLDRWLRFDAERYGSERFYLSQYIKIFLANLNVHSNFPTYNSLDGNQLVSFQCVVRRDEWNAVKEAFHKAFLMQKKAYRRANGGNSAPSLSEDAAPRPLRSAVGAVRLPEEATQHKVVVRRTFLDVDDPSSPEGLGVSERSSRRSKTTSNLQVRASGA